MRVSHTPESLACREYYDEWLHMLDAVPSENSSPGLQVLMFTLDGHYFGFLTSVLRKVMKPRTIYPIPNNHKDFIVGLVKANRKLQLAVDLAYFMLNKKTSKQHANEVFLFLEQEKEGFILPVNTIIGIQSFVPEQLKPVDASSQALYLGKLMHEKNTVSLINHHHFFKTLDKLLESSPLHCGI